MTNYMFGGADPTCSGTDVMFRPVDRDTRSARPFDLGNRAVMELTTVVLAATTSAVLAFGLEVQFTDGLLPTGVNVGAARSVPEAYDPLRNIEASRLSPKGKRVARDILALFIKAVPRLQACADPDDDDGLTLEFENEENGRIVVYAIPHSGERQFIVAEEDDGYWTGMITRERGNNRLARWLAGELGHRNFKGVEWST